MNKLEQAARQALEALELHLNGCGVAIATRIAYEALGKALAEQAEQEPVAWRDSNGWFTSDKQLVNTKYDKWTAVYAAPVRTKDLTDDEIRAIRFNWERNEFAIDFARAVIAADREKNRG